MHTAFPAPGAFEYAHTSSASYCQRQLRIFAFTSVAPAKVGLNCAASEIPGAKRLTTEAQRTQRTKKEEITQESFKHRHPGESREVDSHLKCNTLEKTSAGVWKSRHLRGV